MPVNKAEELNNWKLNRLSYGFMAVIGYKAFISLSFEDPQTLLALVVQLTMAKLI